MKKCRRCSKPATLHITEIRDGKATALHLCETCAREYLESNEQETSPAGNMDISSKLEELVNEGSEEALAGLACPNCGITFAEFRESGRFGCPADYNEFLPQILPLLENIHEDTTHIGKKPKHRNAAASPDYTRMIQLRKGLQEAVECEDYESAAKLRDTIAALEAEGYESGKESADKPSPGTPSKPPSKRRRKTDEPSE